MSFIAGATMVGAVWLVSDTPQPTIEVITQNVISPAAAPAVEVNGPIGFDEWAEQISAPNHSSVVGLHLGGEAPTDMAQAMLFRDDGHLITSAHAIAGASDITAVLHDGSATPAQLVAADPVSGVAVIKIASPELPPPTYSDGRVAPRDRLVGIAGHSGDDGPLVRAVEVVDDDQVAVLPSGDLLSGLFRLSNELDPSWAGAPIVDENGGIVAMAVTSVDGTNYAIPTTLASDVSADLIRDGHTDHVAWLGVHLAPGGLTEQLKAERDLRGGALLTRVWNHTPAARGGLSAGDVIVRFDSVNVLENTDLFAALRSASPGDVVEVRYSRRTFNGSDPLEPPDKVDVFTTTVVLGAQPLR